MGRLVPFLADPGHVPALDGDTMIRRSTLEIIQMAAGVGLFGAVVAGAIAYPEPIQIALSLGGFFGFLIGHWVGSDNQGNTP